MSPIVINVPTRGLLAVKTKDSFVLMLLKRTRVPAEDLAANTTVHVLDLPLDYACPVFHHSLPQYLQSELESVQKRALAWIFS